MKIAATTMKKIGIFRALQLGDMLCMMPAARALRNAYPDAEITLIGLPWAASFCTRFAKYFNRFIHFPGYPGLPEQSFLAADYEIFAEKVSKESFDLILQMQGNGTIVNEMISGWGAALIGGFRMRTMSALSPLFLQYPEGIHEINRHLALMEHLGICACGDELEFPVTAEEESTIESLNLPFGKKEYVIIHPGSRGSYRQWPPQHFAQAARLCHELGYHVVLTGTSEEQYIIEQVTDHLPFPYYDAGGKTGLGAAAVLIRDAALIVCNCTGVSHIASAMKTPGVIISMDGEPGRWGPLDKRLQTTFNWLEHPDLDKVLNTVRNKLADSVYQTLVL